MEYVEFRICIKSKHSRCIWPENKEGLEGTIQQSNLARRAIAVLSRLVEKKQAERPEFELLGMFLFHVLFDQPAENAFRKQFEDVRKERDRKRLRVVLHFEPEADALAKLPWEYLYVPAPDDRAKGSFLAANDELVLSRHVPLSVPNPVAERGVLKVLALACSPNGLKTVLSEEVIGEIEQLPGATVQKLINPDKKRFAQSMREFRPHIVHFFGHGQFDKVGKKGSLAFVHEKTQDPVWVDEAALADICQEARPRLVFLQACEGAQSDNYSIFEGVALSLVGATVPGVIAMKYEINNVAARTFALSFYQAVAAGMPIDAAVQEGRKKLGELANDGNNYCTREFGTPVVYLQSKLFETDQRIVIPGPESAPEPKPLVLEKDQNRRLPCPYQCGERVFSKGTKCPNQSCMRPFVICPNCRCAIKAGQAVCEFCGEALPTHKAPAIAARPEPVTAPTEPVTAQAPEAAQTIQASHRTAADPRLRPLARSRTAWSGDILLDDSVGGANPDQADAPRDHR